MGDFGLLLYYLLIALLAFFVAAPYLLNTISLFGVQEKFVKTMVDEGIIAEDVVNTLQSKKKVAGIIVSVVLLGILFWLCFRLRPWGFAMGLLPLLLGFWKFRKVVQFNSLTARRFYSSYHGQLDEKKFDKYIKKHF